MASRIGKDRLSALGVLLLQGMDEHGYPPTALALSQLLGVSNASTARWLVGVSRPPRSALQLLALKLELGLDELYSLAGLLPADAEITGSLQEKRSSLVQRHILATRIARLAGPNSALPGYLRERLLVQLAVLCAIYDRTTYGVALPPEVAPARLAFLLGGSSPLAVYERGWLAEPLQVLAEQYEAMLQDGD